ncbi:sensor histidine kinase [Micromonospora avicenniae]|uniref:histidine kinase n=1 Tax=Micromonospora avicenniae TaxID=1198245 RepID=A0A1N6S5D7_9ACTN|nr:nitrate- and nitrite sensing domain-containing protein [Micromonospora avicenniae]SIQ36299.1 Signal transduction histidine kinase [Micromonospora avicenniae]
MRSRGTNLRTKVVALLVSLVALWSFAAWVTLRDGVNLLGVQTVDSKIVAPSEPLLLELQVERRLSTAQLGSSSSAGKDELAASRQRVDAAAAEFRESAQSWLADLMAGAEAERTVDAAIAALNTLPATRESIDSRDLDRAAAAKAYTQVVDSMFQLYDVVGGLDDPDIEADTRNLIELYRIRELMSQEDALLTGALAAGRTTPAENVEFTQLVAAQRFLAGRASDQLRPSERTQFDQVIAGPSFTKLREIEDRILQSERTRSKPAVSAQEWNDASQSALSELQDMVLSAGDAVVDRAAPVAVWVIVRLLLAAGLGLLAVIASIVVSVTTARALVAQLQRLSAAAHKLADERLPGVVERLGRGEKVDVAAEAPPLDFGDDEIGKVGEAFNRVQETAIATAVMQAQLRQGVRDVFLSLARRTQSLVHRQVSLLDEMERREQDSEELEDLFRVDHLAVRMRRNAENLVVLSGAAPARAWRRDVPMVDVVRGAVQEVEDYQRVSVMPIESVGLAGRAVGDIIHLLAELIENALSFSPPHTEVQVRGQLVARGFAVEIEDRGLGMDAAELKAANEQIAQHQEFSLSNANKLGLFVVSRLADRHKCVVHLKTSPYGGTTAVVLIPMGLVTNATAPGVGAGGIEGETASGKPAERQPALTAPSRPEGLVDAPISALTSPTPKLGSPVVHKVPSQRTPDATTGSPSVLPARSAPPAAPSAQESQTPSGLPVRVRQTSLAPQLRDNKRPAAESTDEDEPARNPDRVRMMMSSYQKGTQRGRAETERRLGDDKDTDPRDTDGSAATETER